MSNKKNFNRFMVMKEVMFISENYLFLILEEF